MFAGVAMEDEQTLEHYGVPPGCKCLMALDSRQLRQAGGGVENMHVTDVKTVHRVRLSV
jgi:hypothetical protein